MLVCGVKVDTKIQALSVETNKLSKLPLEGFFQLFHRKKLKIYIHLDTDTLKPLHLALYCNPRSLTSSGNFRVIIGSRESC